MDYLAQTAGLLAKLFPSLLAGFLITIGVAAVAIPMALALGLALLPARMSNIALVEFRPAEQRNSLEIALGGWRD